MPVLVPSCEWVPQGWARMHLQPVGELLQAAQAYRPHEALEPCGCHAIRVGTHSRMEAVVATLIGQFAAEDTHDGHHCAGCSIHRNAAHLRKLQLGARLSAHLLTGQLSLFLHRQEPDNEWPGAIALGKQLQDNTTALGRTKTRVTLATLDGMQTLTPQEKRFCMRNIDMEEHSVVAYLLWARLETRLPPQLPMAVFLQLHMLELKDYGQLFDGLRAQAGAAALQTTLLHVLRKIMHLTGRDLAAADWDTERQRSDGLYNRRDRIFTSRWYLREFQAAAQHVAATTIRNTYSRRLQTLNDWWASRMMNAPNGSSSHRHTVDEKRTKSHSSGDRPNKKVVYSYMGDNTPVAMMQLEPHVVARCSTKPEPGRKHRALYAACDCSSIVSSWASVGLESAMNWGGMVAKQAPADVLEWLQQHRTSLAIGGTWSSLDYADFNKEHSAWELTLLNLALAREWALHPQESIREDKYTAALWTAASNSSRWAKTSDATWRVNSGLYSGHRDTARDNTMLHYIYSRIQQRLLLELGVTLTPVYTVMCGDDEDTHYSNTADAYMHYAVATSAGWHLNPKKQMLGSHTHEFVQVLCDGAHAPTQPLIPNIVAFVDGNWYKDPLQDIGSTAEAVMRLGVELIQRGAAPKQTLDLCHGINNRWYRWIYGQHVRWDATLSAELRLHPVLAQAATRYAPQCGTAALAPPHLTREVAMHHPPGMVALEHKLWPLLQLVPGQARKRVLSLVQWDAFRSWYTTAWNAALPKPHLHSGKPLPPLVALCQPATLDEVIIIGLHTLDRDDPPTAKEISGITGIPLPLLQILPLHKVGLTAGTAVSGYTALLTAPPDKTIRNRLRGTTYSSMTWFA